VTPLWRPPPARLDPSAMRRQKRHQRGDPEHLSGMSSIGSRVLAAVLTLTWAAYGHAIVLSSTPGQRQEVSGPDVPIHLRFNSRIDAQRSRLILVMPDGRQVALPPGQAGAEDSLVSEAKGLNAGAYMLRWQVLASDGHISRGEVQFRVK